MKILICDNDPDDIHHLSHLLNEYCQYRQCTIKEIKICQHSSEIYSSIQDCDLLFLDVELDHENGIDIGMQIKTMNCRCRIIITSAFQDYLISGYKINARRYLLKPIEKIEFFIEMDSIMNDYFKNQQGFYDRTIQSGKIFYHQILFIEAYNRKTKIKLENGKSGIVKYSLSEWIEILKDQPFDQSHKSVLVNFKAIKTIGKQDIYLKNGQTVPVSRHYRKSFLQKYTNFLQYEDYE